MQVHSYGSVTSTPQIWNLQKCIKFIHSVTVYFVILHLAIQHLGRGRGEKLTICICNFKDEKVRLSHTYFTTNSEDYQVQEAI